MVTFDKENIWPNLSNHENTAKPLKIELVYLIQRMRGGALKGKAFLVKIILKKVIKKMGFVQVFCTSLNGKINGTKFRLSMF